MLKSLLRLYSHSGYTCDELQSEYPINKQF